MEHQRTYVLTGGEPTVTKIIEGLKDAVAYVKGDKSRGRASVVTVRKVPRLGAKQIELLRTLASPHLFLIVSDKIVLSLVKHGLVKAMGKDQDSFFQITPFGMRVAADLWQSKQIDFPLPRPMKKPTKQASV